jgi:hypothetical protein
LSHVSLSSSVLKGIGNIRISMTIGKLFNNWFSIRKFSQGYAQVVRRKYILNIYHMTLNHCEKTRVTDRGSLQEKWLDQFFVVWKLIDWVELFFPKNILDMFEKDYSRTLLEFIVIITFCMKIVRKRIQDIELFGTICLNGAERQKNAQFLKFSFEFAFISSRDLCVLYFLENSSTVHHHHFFQQV